MEVVVERQEEVTEQAVVELSTELLSMVGGGVAAVSL